MKVSDVSFMNSINPLRVNKSKNALKFGMNYSEPSSDLFTPEEPSLKRIGMYGQDLDDPLDPRNEDDISSPFYKQKDILNQNDLYQQSIEEQNREMEDLAMASVIFDPTNPFSF